MNVTSLFASTEAALITSPSNLFYLSGVANSDAYILVKGETAFYITDSRYEIEARSLAPDFRPIILGSSAQIDFIRDALESVRSIGIEKEHLSLARFDKLFGSFGAEFIPIDGMIRGARRIKSPSELKTIAEAEAIVDTAFRRVLDFIKPGVTEKQVSDRLLFEMLSEGASGVAFDTIVAFGENAAKPHAVPSDRALRRGDAIVMDFGAKKGGYCSDFTRTLFCGKPDRKFESAYDVVLRAQLAALDYIASGGRSAFEADRIARSLIDGSPFKGKFTHSLGHGVGVEIHEDPYLSARSEDILADGAVFTVEPGVYLEGEFGIRIESLAAIENGKLTVFDRSDKEIILV